MTADFERDDEPVYVGTLPRWMVRQMRSDARYSKRTAVTSEGEKEAEKIERTLTMILDRDEQRSTLEDRRQVDRIRIRIAFEDTALEGGDPIQANYEGVRDQVIERRRQDTHDLLEGVVRQQFEQIYEQWEQLREDA